MGADIFDRAAMRRLFDRARRNKAVEDLAGKLVTLRRQGNELRGDCPLCGEKAKIGSKFKVEPVRQTWHCFACGRHGDVVDLHAETARLSLIEAALQLAGPEPLSEATQGDRRPEKATQDPDSDARKARIAADMWANAKPLMGSLGERYLIARGLGAWPGALLPGLRFHPDAPHHWDGEARRWITAPAIVAQVGVGGAWTGGVHATYLAPDGCAKTGLEPAKRMWGAQGLETPLGRRPGGAILRAIPATDIVVGEGIETAISLALWLTRREVSPLSVCAALSLNRLQGRLETDDEGCFDPWNARGEPGSSFTITAWAGDREVGTVWIAIDRDMAPIRLKGRTGRGKVSQFELDGEARGRLCAKLATQAWREAGWPNVRCMWPGVGQDWNDVVRLRAVA